MVVVHARVAVLVQTENSNNKNDYLETLKYCNLVVYFNSLPLS